MNDWEKKPTMYPRPSDELRKLITEHPDLPLLVMAGDTANDGDHSYTVCSYIRAELGEVLDCEQGVDDTMIFTDREEFEEKLGDNFYDPKIHDDLTEEEYDKLVKAEVAQYDPYWKDCILLYVDN